MELLTLIYATSSHLAFDKIARLKTCNCFGVKYFVNNLKNNSVFFLENWSIFVLTICLLEVFISLLAFIYCCLALCWKGFVLEEGFDHGDEEVPQQQFSQELPYTQQHDSPQDQVSIQKP